MEPYQERVISEMTELAERINKLSAFIGSSPFVHLPYSERSRLKIQYHIMKAYESILKERIEEF